MRQKKSSIHLQALKHKRISIQTMQIPQQLFSFLHISQLPTLVSQKLDSVNSYDKHIIKATVNPYGYLVSFYIAFLKLLFIQKPAFEKCVTKLFQILDDDHFIVQMVKDEDSFLYLDWSISKMKRMTSEYFKQIMIEEYQSVNHILQENTEFAKILFFVFWSLLHDSKRVQNFEEFIEFDTVKEVLFDYFEIQAYQNQDGILIPDSNILIEYIDDRDLYIINLPNFQSELQKGTSKSIHIKYDMNGSDMASDLKLTLQSNLFISDDETNLVKTRNFADLTNRTENPKQNMQKTLRFRQLRFNTQQDRPSLTARQDDFMNESEESDRSELSNEQNLYRTQVDDCKAIRKKLEGKYKVNQLFEMASHRTATQKSLYDVNPIEDSDEYSVLDISIPTSKKIHEKQINKQNEIQDMAESLKPQHESLIGKWYEFCKTKKSKADIQSKISKIGKKVQKKSHFQQATQKPDFRKVKSRRRKSQDFDQENYPSENTTLSTQEKKNVSITSGQKQSAAHQQAQQQQKKVKEYILHNPKGNLKGENIYSKFGYVNMNISEEFTDSLILKELEAKNESNIKAIKEKAREERKTIKLLVEKSDKPDIIKL